MDLTKSVSKARPGHRTSGRRWLWIGVLVLLVAGGSALYFTGILSRLTGQSAVKSGPDYHTATARRGDIILSASGSGTLTAGQSVDLSFSSKGILSELDVKAGDAVTTGQVLAKIGNTQALEAAVTSDQLQLLQAQQALSTLQLNANGSLAQAFQDMITAQQKYNDALVADQRTAYARCSQQVNTRDKAALDLATTKLQNISQLYYGSDAWINAKNNYDQALANYQYCISYTPDEKTNAGASLQVAKVALDQATTNYKTLSASAGVDPYALALAEAKATDAQAQLAQAQSDLEGATLKAPINGVVTFVAATTGTMVDTTKFITISDLTHPAVQVSVDETDLDKFTVGANAEVVFDALPDQTFTGKVTQVQPQLTASGQYNVATGLVQLDPSAVKALEKLPLGLSASVTIIDQQAKNALLVPVQALRDLGNHSYAVFVVGGDGKLQLRPVKVGLMDTTHAEIQSGLKDGDVVSTGVVQSAN